MSDAWEEFQAVKTKRNTLRDKLNKRRKEREDLLLGGASEATSPTLTQPVYKITSGVEEHRRDSSVSGRADKEVEDQILKTLTDLALNLPTDSGQICNLTISQLGRDVPHVIVKNVLQKFAAQELIRVSEDHRENKAVLTVTWAEHARLVAMVADLENVKLPEKRAAPEDDLMPSPATVKTREDVALRPVKKERKDSRNDDVMSLLSLASTRERETKRMGEEILDLLSKPTAKERSLVERFRSQGGAQVQEFCAYGTREECRKARTQAGEESECRRLHFRKIIQQHTDESLGDCSFLNTCFHMETCKYVHYQVDYQSSKAKTSESEAAQQPSAALDKVVRPVQDLGAILYPPQWIQCDLRTLDMSILGKCSVIMADPPWDIHMELPYGTLSDDEMRHLNIPVLQDDGLIFLWVTGRAMELGRECLELWGYERVDEIIWVKTNQLQRIIRTGRTGHWLNHGKEHCLVGMKGNPRNLNKGLDCDVIVAEVRATSHKPDEMYGMIERLSPGTRKIELFGRPHNVQPNWITLGNQLDGVHLLDPDIARAFQKRYPDGNCC